MSPIDPRMLGAIDTVEHPDWTLETDLRCTHDLEGRLLSVSAAVAHALGYQRDDLLKIPLSDLVAPEFRTRFRLYLDRIRHNGTASGLIELCKSGGEKVVWEYWNSL